MSQLAGVGATPRRSARLSQAGSVTGQSAVTNMTTGGTRQRKKGPLTKVKARKSNAYGASGRVGAAEELSVTTTGFAQAFQHQRGDAVIRDDSDDSDDIDELGAETPRMSGALSVHAARLSPSPAPETSSRLPPSFSFLEDSEGMTPSENDMSTSFGNTSKSFGLVHEAGMLFRPLQHQSSRPQSDDDEEEPYSEPLWLKNKARRFQGRTTNQERDKIEVELPASQKRPAQASPAEKAAIHQSVDKLIAEEQARQQNGGLRQQQTSPRVPVTAQLRKDPQVVNEWLGNVEPGQKNEHTWAWKQIAAYAGVVLLGLLVLSQLLHQFTPSGSAPRGMPAAIGSRMLRSWNNLADWIIPSGNSETDRLFDEFKIVDGSPDDNFLWSRMKILYKEFDGRIGEIRNTITELNDHLPDFMVVRRHPDGRREVTDEFWNALISKAKSSSDSIEWAAFLKNNQKKLRDILGVPMPLDSSDPGPEVVPRDEFVRLMQEHYKTLSTQVDQRIKETVKSQAVHIKSIAQVEAKKAIIDSIRLDSLAKSNLIANYELNLLKPNYFSPGLGAQIDPTLTSATFLDNPHFLANTARKLALVPPSNPPKVALEKWEEPGDCWCAAPNPNKGQAQLAVTIARPMFPTQVTIEHVPMSMMPAKKVTTAPRLIELWVETDEPAHYQYAHRNGVCEDGPAGWTCLGSFAYNVHGSNHRQTFDLDARSSVPITKALLRVTSNWGADHTCLYRVRLHGKDAVEDHHYEA